MVQTTGNPIVEQAVTNAMRVFRATLAEAMGQAFYGNVNIQFNFQNGKLTLIKATHERSYNVRE